MRIDLFDVCVLSFSLSPPVLPLCVCLSVLRRSAVPFSAIFFFQLPELSCQRVFAVRPSVQCFCWSTAPCCCCPLRAALVPLAPSVSRSGGQQRQTDGAACQSASETRLLTWPTALDCDRWTRSISPQTQQRMSCRNGATCDCSFE